MLDQTALIASRAQSDLYAQAGLDWARGILAESQRTGTGADSLDQPWARPMAGLPVERAVVAGAIADEQGKYNLNNLVNGTQKSPADVEIFKRLLASDGLDPELAYAVLDWVDPDGDLSGNGGAEDAYYLSLPKPYRAANQPMVQVEELYRVRGFDAAAVRKIRPFVTALPGRTTVNVNTAPPEVIAAILPEVSTTRIAQMAKERVSRPFKTRDQIAAWAKEAPAGNVTDNLDVKSGFFRVRIQVAQDDVQVATDALVQRTQAAVTSVVWRRPRY
jgi:general secretion pathway protein K